MLDSIGDNVNQSIWVGGNKKNYLKNIVRNNQCDLGRIYKFVTLILKMKPDEHEFKVMGLAPYANKINIKKITNKVFDKILKFKDLSIVHNKRPKNLYCHLKKELKNYRFDDIAGAVQYYLETMVVELVVRIIKKFKVNKIFFGGGVSMNVKMYNKILKNSKVRKIYNAPSGSDESLTMGACFYLNRDFKSHPLKKNRFRPSSGRKKTIAFKIG